MDNWTSLEPLLDLTAGQGPATTGLPLNAVVADAIIEGAWWIERSRSRNPVISLIKQCLPDPIPISQGNNDDQYLWKHLFYNFPYASAVWSLFMTKLHLSPPVAFEDGVRWLKDPTRDMQVNFLVKLIFQASVYSIWKERNSRIHSAPIRPPDALIQDIRNTIDYLVVEGIYTLPKLRNRGCRKAETQSFPRRRGILPVLRSVGYIKAAYLVTGG
ncbi:BnaC04g13860D [Brassica napus]|uniref:BnaC04g13860D protein n=1 Tax=Brassica napus TaxID=3708 RepID=A0A078ICS1_BRANA|nr:BnaC04g13860D [Brassica napus]